jgi:hypothetical protein
MDSHREANTRDKYFQYPQNQNNYNCIVPTPYMGSYYDKDWYLIR